MGAKALYTDTRNKTVIQLVLTKNIEKLAGIFYDLDNYHKYKRSWRAVNLDEYVAKFDITSDTYNMTNNLRKISFYKDNREYAIVAAVGAPYFRVQQINSDGSGGRYVGLDLKDPSISGKEFEGAKRKAEWKRLTHFRMTYKEGTI
ncbi:MAG: hypothetical protein K6G50_11565 [bacterium]|nr:hypothetical protein [bacterium]